VVRGAVTMEAHGATTATTTVRDMEVVVCGVGASRAKQRGFRGSQTEKKATVNVQSRTEKKMNNGEQMHSEARVRGNVSTPNFVRIIIIYIYIFLFLFFLFYFFFFHLFILFYFILFFIFFKKKKKKHI